jgi:hypothetical protein
MNTDQTASPRTDAIPQTASGAVSDRLRRFARDPLVHFFLLGAAIFLVDQVLLRSRGDAQTINVSAAVQSEARNRFMQSLKREPSGDDMKILVNRWVDNEVLYREGLALGLDRGDNAIRERVIFKALSVTQSGITLPRIDEAGLKAWFDARKDRYGEPTRVDFLEAVVTSDRSEAALRRFVEGLNGQSEIDAQSSLRVFKDRPRDNIVQSYGAAFADALQKLPPGQWQILESADGPRVIRLEVIKPGKSAEFDAIKESVYQDWKDETMAALSTKAVREMGSKYRVNVEKAGS